ncbi:MAG: helix-turn-helix transcriptional regulator [Sandaracinaceae bacterium]
MTDGTDSVRPRSEGQRQLLARPESHAEIAERLGCTKQVVSYWRRGSKRPGAKNRESMADAFGIPAKAWSQQPADQPRPAQRDLRELTPLEHAEELLRQARQRRERGDLMDADYNKALTLESRLLDQTTRLRREAERAKAEAELLQARVIAENPAWQRFREILTWLAEQLEPVEPSLAAELDRRLAEVLED